MSWSTVDGHYWLEVHLDHSRRVPDTKWHPDLIDFKLRVKKNLEGIMQLADVSQRGRELLFRDLQRMCDEEMLEVMEGGNVDEQEAEKLHKKIGCQVAENAEFIERLESIGNHA